MIANDNTVVRDGLAAILRSQKDIKLVAEATNGEEACQLYDQLSLGILILDLQMPKKDGLQVVKEPLLFWESVVGEYFGLPFAELLFCAQLIFLKKVAVVTSSSTGCCSNTLPRWRQRKLGEI